MEPPNSVTFDPVKRQAVLRPSRQAASSATTSGAQGSDIAIVSSMVLALLGNRAATPSPATAIVPVTPTHALPEQATALSPAVPTPSKLSRFLNHAETKLGVPEAHKFELALQMKGYGPDILHMVKDSDLGDIGISPGNIIRLKLGASKWWNGPDAKRKHNEVDDDHPDKTRPIKRVRFEKRFHDGGGFTFHAPEGSMVPGQASQSNDYDTYYYCEARKDMVPVPTGFIVCEESEDNPFAFGY